MKEAFKDWVKAKKEENYKLENLYDEKTRKNYMLEDSDTSAESSKEGSSKEGQDKDSKDTKENPE